MSRTLVAHEQPISKIFGEDYVFSIPGYQRPYAWTIEQAGELLDDLLGFMRANPGTATDAPPYFLGSIVIIKQDGSPDATVVDGQQRLTTLTILLSVIRSGLTSEEEKKDLSSFIYQKGNRVRGTENQYRMTLRERDRDFFRNYVQHEDGIGKLVSLNDKLSDSQNRIRENARYFYESLARIDDAEKLDLATFISTRCYLVTVATPDLDSAYRIFHVLNSRGLDLSATDILKATIISNVPPDDRDAFTKRWEDIEEQTGRDAFSELFSHIRMAYRKAKSQGTLLKEFEAHVPIANAQAFIEDILDPMATAYQEINDAAYVSARNAVPVNQSLYWLNRVEFKDWIPPALVFYVRYRNAPDLMARFFADLERMVYALLVAKAGINERIEIFSKLTDGIEKEIDLFGATSSLQLDPVFQHRVYAALDGPLYASHSAKALAVILLRIDGLISEGGARYDYDTISVEHVLPQTPAPASQWFQWFPDPKVHAYWVHRLGNLALLSRRKNSSASNYEFDKKKKAYFTRNGISPFALTTQVLQHDVWAEPIISQRHKDLMAKMESYWRLHERTESIANLL
jgi:hypothetical protein